MEWLTGATVRPKGCMTQQNQNKEGRRGQSFSPFCSVEFPELCIGVVFYVNANNCRHNKKACYIVDKNALKGILESIISSYFMWNNWACIKGWIQFWEEASKPRPRGALSSGFLMYPLDNTWVLFSPALLIGFPPGRGHSYRLGCVFWILGCRGQVITP